MEDPFHAYQTVEHLPRTLSVLMSHNQGYSGQNGLLDRHITLSMGPSHTAGLIRENLVR